MATRRHRLATETSTRFRLHMEAARERDLTGGALDCLPLNLPVTTGSSGSIPEAQTIPAAVGHERSFMLAGQISRYRPVLQRLLPGALITQPAVCVTIPVGTVSEALRR
jgi:hypothetical protein